MPAWPARYWARPTTTISELEGTLWTALERGRSNEGTRSPTHFQEHQVPETAEEIIAAIERSRVNTAQAVIELTPKKSTLMLRISGPNTYSCQWSGTTGSQA